MKGGGRSRYTKTYTEIITEPSGGAAADSCKSISFLTQLQKVTPAILSLSVKEELFINSKKAELITVDSAGNECGSIISAYNAQLLECIAKGFSFKAIVTSISGSVCKVRVQIA